MSTIQMIINWLTGFFPFAKHAEISGDTNTAVIIVKAGRVTKTYLPVNAKHADANGQAAIRLMGVSQVCPKDSDAALVLFDAAQTGEAESQIAYKAHLYYKDAAGKDAAIECRAIIAEAANTARIEGRAGESHKRGSANAPKALVTGINLAKVMTFAPGKAPTK